MKKFTSTLLIFFFSFFISVLAFDDWQQTTGPKDEEGNVIPVYSLVFNSNDVLFAGTAGVGIYKSTDYGNTWTISLDNSISVWKLLLDNNGHIYAATEYDGLWKSTDDGESWQLSLDVSSWVMAIAKSYNNILFAGTELDGLYFSDDDGDSWHQIWLPELPIMSIAVDEYLNIFAGTAGDGVYKSTDFGDNWNYEALAGFLVWELLPYDNYTKIIVGSEGDGLWNYNVADESWNQIGFPNQAINVIAVNSQGKFALSNYGTEVDFSDENMVWYPFSAGLPESGVNNLVFDSKGYLYASFYDYPVYKTTKTTYLPTLSVNSLMSYTCAGENYTFSVEANDAYYPDNEFRIELSDPVNGFDNPTVIGFVNATSSTNIDITIPPNTPYNEGYRFRAVSTNPVVESEISDPFIISPIIPNLSAPDNDAMDVALNPTLYWVELTDCVDHYRLLVDDDEDFLSPVVEQFELTGSSYQIQIDLQSNKKYYWKVAGVRASGVYAYSEVYSFTTISTSIELTTYATIACAGTNESVYYTISGNFEADNEFKIELSDENGNFVNPLVIGNVSSQESGQINVTLPHTLLHSLNYKIRLVSTNPALTSSVSNAIEIKSIKPELILPENDDVNVSRIPTLEWSQPSDCVASYRLLVDDNEDFLSPIIEEFDYTSNFYTFTSKLAYNKKYYWKVAGINSQGVYNFSDVFNFTTEPLTEVTQNIPMERGWNLISLNVVPPSRNVKDILAGIKSKIIILKNTAGKIYLASNDYDNINGWNNEEGYLIYATEVCTLSVTGLPVIPSETPISFSKSGWNYVPYLRNSDLSIVTALSTLTDANKMIIAKTGKGVIYLPPNINQIGNMKPGLGYQIYITGAVTLTYPDND